jgi:hypothetical protein
VLTEPRHLQKSERDEALQDRIDSLSSVIMH